MTRALYEVVALTGCLLWLSACQALTGLDQLHTPESASTSLPTDTQTTDTQTTDTQTTDTQTNGQSRQAAPENEARSSDPEVEGAAGGSGMAALPLGDAGVQPMAALPAGGMTGGALPNQGDPSKSDQGAGGSAGNLSDPGAARPPPSAADAGPPSGLPVTTTRNEMPSTEPDGGMPQPPVMMPAPSQPDAGPPVPPDPMCTPPFPGATCDTAPQCGCAAGENCAYLVTLDIPACVRPGTVGLNQHCDLATQCQVGLQCLGGACLELCDPAAMGCENERGCVPTFSSGRPITGLYTCNSDCNLADPQRQSGALVSCGRDLTCVWFGEGASCAYGGQSGGRHGELCTDSFDCAAGYTCLDSGTCARWCAGTQDCPSGFSCEDANVTVADTRFGLCRPSCNDPRELSCEIDPQCGCEGQMACDFLEQTSDHFIHGCRSTGSTRPYELCDSDENCGAGATCAGGTCSPFCERASDCGGPYARCEQVVDRSEPNDPPIPGFQVCARPCDPADLRRAHGPYEACPSNRHCRPTEDGRSYCVESDPDAQWGSSCDGTSNCAAGFSCTVGFGCLPQCRYDSDCDAGYYCDAFNPRLFAETVEWGVCVQSTPPAQ